MSTQTLSKRLLYTLFPWYLLLVLSMIAAQLALQYFSVSRDIDRDLASLGRTVQPAVTESVWELDTPQLRSMARGIRQNAIVSGVEIDSVKGEVLVADGMLPLAPDTEGGILPRPFRQAVLPLAYQSPRGDTRLIGQLHLFASRQVVWSRTRYSFFSVLLNSLVVTTGLWLLFSWTIRFRLSDTVTRVAGAVANWRFQATDMPVEHTEYPYHDELGQLVHALNDMLSSTEARKRELVRTNQLLADSEARLKQSNEQLEQRVKDRTAELQALFESASVGIALLHDRVILRCNQRMDEMFGYDEGEQVGKSTRLWYADEAAWLAGDGDEQIQRGETQVSAHQLVRKDGKPFWVRMSNRAIDASNPSKGSVLVVEDITAEFDAMEQMTRARMLAEQGTRMKSEFLANMSHEIRTPMNAVLGMLYLALRTELSPAQQNYLLKAQGAANSLLGIINDILDFSKIEAGRLEIEQVEFSLDAVLDSLNDMVSHQAGQKGIVFRFSRDESIPPLLLGDALRIGQVLLNLCGNAVKFTEQGEVELEVHAFEVSTSDLVIQCCVRDTGIGMSTELQARLFEKFTQADQSTTRRFGGTGLGLAISKKLVDLMGGRIWIEHSEPDRGSTLCFTLPLKVAALAQARPLPSVESGRRFAGRRVLLVEDNAINREFSSELLGREGITVDTAVNGHEALIRVQQQHYDAVLMDIQMPVMGGLEAARHLRALGQGAGGEALRSVPIIAMSALAMAQDIERSRAAGMNDHVTKPVAPDILMAVLARWLPPQQQADTADTAVPAAPAGTGFPPDLEALTSLHAREGVHRIGGKVEAYRKQLRRFREHYADAADALQRLLGAGAALQALEYCHMLRGVTGNLGAMALCEQVGAIEARLGQGALPDAQALAVLRTRVHEVIADIDSLGASSTPAPLPALGPEQLRERLVQLVHALEYDLGAADALLADLLAGVRDTPLAPEISAIAAHIDEFSLDEALRQLRQLQERLTPA